MIFRYASGAPMNSADRAWMVFGILSLVAMWFLSMESLREIAPVLKLLGPLLHPRT